MIDRLVTAGFENHDDDLEAEFYLIRADRSMPELSLIKSMYTSEHVGVSYASFIALSMMLYE